MVARKRRVRISATDELRRPCDAAFSAEFLRRDARSTDDPAKVPFYVEKATARKEPVSTDWWYGEGLNHRIEDGRIVRDQPDRGWFIEADLDEIVRLMKLYGWRLEIDQDVADGLVLTEG